MTEKGIMQIHAIWKISARREQALVAPEPTPVMLAIPAPWWPIIDNDVRRIWDPSWAPYGWQPWMIRRLLAYYTLWATTRLGYSITPAREFAMMAVKAFVQNAISYTTVPVMTIMGAAIVALVILVTVWALWPREGYWAFADGECFMMYQNKIWFAHVIAHPYPNVWDVRLCTVAGEGVWVQRRNHIPGYPQIDLWDFSNLLEWWAAKLVGYYVWALRFGYCSFVGRGKEVIDGVYRVWPQQDFRGMWRWPVGWVRSLPDTCGYWLTLKETFIVQ